MEYVLDCKTQKFVEVQKNQGLKEFHMLAHMGCYCIIIVFSPFKLEITYNHSFKGNKFLIFPE